MSKSFQGVKMIVLEDWWVFGGSCLGVSWDFTGVFKEVQNGGSRKSLETFKEVSNEYQ